MSYTKKQRNEIYKEALYGYTLFDCQNTLGLCLAIKRITGNDLHYFDEHRPSLFPEFDLFFNEGEIWFDLDYDMQGFIARQNILSLCIAMTEN